MQSYTDEETLTNDDSENEDEYDENQDENETIKDSSI